MLVNERAVLPQLKQPGFFIERISNNANATICNFKERSIAENLVTITMPKDR